MPEQQDRPNRLLTPAPPQNGPVVGTIIVMIIMLLGALYFGVQQIAKQRQEPYKLPLIQSGTTTITIITPATSSRH